MAAVHRPRPEATLPVAHAAVEAVVGFVFLDAAQHAQALGARIKEREVLAQGHQQPPALAESHAGDRLRQVKRVVHSAGRMEAMDFLTGDVHPVKNPFPGTPNGRLADDGLRLQGAFDRSDAHGNILPGLSLRNFGSDAACRRHSFPVPGELPRTSNCPPRSTVRARPPLRIRPRQSNR